MNKQWALFGASVGSLWMTSLGWCAGPDDVPPPSRRPVMPLYAALDRNSDGEVSSDEIDNAAAALRTLDKDSDGKLSRDEMRPHLGRHIRHAGHDEGRDEGRDADRDRPHGRGPDRHHDRDHFRGRPDDGHHPDDHASDSLRREGEHRRHEEGDRPGRHRRGGPAGPPRGDAGPPKGEGGPPRGEAGRGPRRGFGPPSPEMFIERALTFDQNEDGLLSKEELSAMAHQMGRGRRPAGPPAAHDDHNRPELEADDHPADR